MKTLALVLVPGVAALARGAAPAPQVDLDRLQHATSAGKPFALRNPAAPALHHCLAIVASRGTNGSPAPGLALSVGGPAKSTGGIHMGWGRMFLLGNVGQQMDIDELKEYLNRAIDEINKGDEVDADQNRAIEQLRRQNRELQLYVLAMVKLLARKGVLTEAEVSQVVSAVEDSAGTQAEPPEAS